MRHFNTIYDKISTHTLKLRTNTEYMAFILILNFKSKYSSSALHILSII